MLKYAALNRELTTVIRSICARNERVIVDYARENVKLKDIDLVFDVTQSIAQAVPSGSMCALKLSSFGVSESRSHATSSVHRLVDIAKARGVRICIDAEDVLYPDICYELMRTHNTSSEVHVYNTYQMYRRDALSEMKIDVCKSMDDGFMIGLKLVRGAYLKKQPGVFTAKGETDAQYDAALVEALSTSSAHTVLATHNEISLEKALMFDRSSYVTAQLMGMGRPLGHVDYRYVPYGSLTELTPYLLRRLWERMSWG